jgi:Protein of unknown function (DUF3313)
MIMSSRLLLTATAALLFCGCATTQHASTVKTSGFLRDYSQLTKGTDEQAVLRYVNPSAQWGRYTKVMLKPVVLYAGKGSDLANASQEDRTALANYFTAALYEELKKDYKMITIPGPDVITIRAAITDADQSEVVLDTITTIMPIGLALSTLKRTVGESDSFVGEAQAELEILDSNSNTRLAAAVDRRIGTKALRSKFGGWNHAKEACDHWAEQLREQLVKMSGRM